MHQDIVSLLQPTVFVLRVCGVCPSALRRVHIPMSNRVYAIAMVLIVFYTHAKVIYGLYWILNDITLFYGTLRYVSYAGSILVILVSGFGTSGELVRFLKIMKSVKKSLFSLNINQPDFPGTLLQMCWMVFHFLPILASVMFITYTEPVVERILMYLVVSLVRTGIVCKIGIFMDLLCHKLSLLNWHLNNLNHYWPPFLPRPSVREEDFNELSQEMEWRKSKFVHVNFDSEKLTPEKVREFNKAHLKLHYAYRKLNCIFSMPLLVIYVTAGLNISYQIFYLTCGEFQRNRFSTCVIIFQETVGILLISSLSSICEKEFRTTAHLVHHLLDDDTHSQEVAKELEKFSMILLHRRATFSAAGFFDTNLKIVTRMASLLAPIILFLIQNNNRTRASRNNHQ